MIGLSQSQLAQIEPRAQYLWGQVRTADVRHGPAALLWEQLSPRAKNYWRGRAIGQLLNENQEETVTTRHPTTEHLRRLLVPNPNLPAPLHSIAVQVQIFFDEILSRLDDGPELSTGLRKLLEAKDCFVRQCLLDVEGADDERMDPMTPEEIDSILALTPEEVAAAKAYEDSRFDNDRSFDATVVVDSRIDGPFRPGDKVMITTCNLAGTVNRVLDDPEVYEVDTLGGRKLCSREALVRRGDKPDA